MFVPVRGVSAAVFVFLVAASAAAQSSADLFVTKSAPATATVGSNVTFSITVGNGGPDDAASATLDDTLPGGATYVSYTQLTGPTFTCTTPAVGAAGGTFNCTIATFPAGSPSTATFEVIVNVAANAAGTTLINTATVSAETPDDNPENNSSISGTSVPGGNLADVGIVKTGPASAPADSDVAYTITVTNGGPNDATNVSFTDTLPAGTAPPSPMTFVSFTQNSGPAFNCGSPSTTTTCTIATLPAGSTATFTFTGHIPSGTAAGKTYTNVASVSSDNDPNPDNDTSATSLTVSSVDVGVTKSGPATAVAGGPTYDYVITLSNAGPDAATDASFNDNLPAGVNFVSLVQNTGPAAACNAPVPNTNGNVACTISLLPNGDSAQFTVTVQAAPTVPNGTVVTNTATASTSSADTNPSNDSSTVATTISAQADLSIVKSGPATANAGNDITYTVTVTNNGPSTANSVSWSDTLPAGTTFVSESQTTGPTFTCTTGATVSCSIASLAPSASATFSVVVHVASSTPNGSTISNTATVTSTTADPTPGNNSSTVATTISTSADVAVTKSGPAAALAGSNVTYTITVTNNGPSDAASVTLTDVLPPNTTFVSESQTTGPTFICTTGTTVVCSIATLPAGTSAVFSLTVTFSAALPNGTTVTNTATVSSTTTDPTPANNTSSVQTTVGANADLSVVKSGPATTPSNTTVTYTVTAANAGPSNALNVTLTDNVPAGLTFVSVNQTNGPAFACSGSGPVVCTIATFASGASATFQFTFNVPSGAVAGTVTSNTVTIGSSTLDPNPANNSATATTTIGQSIPALSPLAMALLMAALAAVGWMVAKR
jgi:uncharacterized repeat protein (TIGR01451 family)